MEVQKERNTHLCFYGERHSRLDKGQELYLCESQRGSPLGGDVKALSEIMAVKTLGDSLLLGMAISSPWSGLTAIGPDSAALRHFQQGISQQFRGVISDTTAVGLYRRDRL